MSRQRGRHRRGSDGGGATSPDGAFDLVGIGVRPGARWPRPGDARWIHTPRPRAIWVLDEPNEDARSILGAFGDRRGLLHRPGAAGGGLVLAPVAPHAWSATGTSEMLGMHVPMNPLAGAHRHAGLGFTGYVLVLSDRPQAPAVQPPTPAVAWLTSRFHDRYIVVVEGGPPRHGRDARCEGSSGSRLGPISGDCWPMPASPSISLPAASSGGSASNHSFSARPSSSPSGVRRPPM